MRLLSCTDDDTNANRRIGRVGQKREVCGMSPWQPNPNTIILGANLSLA